MNGLDGVVAAETRLSMVDGQRGELVIAGHRVEELASWRFEDVVDLLWGAPLARTFVAEPSPLSVEHKPTPLMDELRAGVAALRAQDDAEAAPLLMAACPVIVAGAWRKQQGLTPLASRPELGYAANYLWLLHGTEPEPERVRGLETYLNTVVDHGLNASTFTARVIASTGSDLISAISGAIGALKGPLHGGAPGPALDMVFAIGDASRAEEVLRRKIEAGQRLMGFGHRVYKVRDPRADVLAAAAHRLYTRGGDLALYELARAVEATALRLLEEYKPGRGLQTNVEFYTALLLHGVGLPTELFTPTFAISRVAGWIAHCLEQRATGRLIRPQSTYVGAMPVGP
ncbi:MAG: citrate synthase/methylcitrate synthase [Acidobacteriota bacterium]